MFSCNLEVIFIFPGYQKGRKEPGIFGDASRISVPVKNGK